MRNGSTPAGFRPNGLPLGRQSRCRLAPSNPLKAKVDGWGWKPNGLSLGRQSRCRLAPSNPLKAKVDGWGWKLWHALACIGWVDVTALGSIVGHQPLQRHVTAASPAGEHVCETAEPQQDSGPTGCHLVGRAGAV